MLLHSGLDPYVVVLDDAAVALDCGNPKKMVFKFLKTEIALVLCAQKGFY